MKRIERLQLRVKDSELMKAFYRDLMGMRVVYEDDERVVLNHPELHLIKGATELSKRRYNGLFHMAFLLPSQKDLGTFTKHVIKHDLKLLEVSDHLFSKAIYFRDPEENGIEVYADADRSNWMFDASGEQLLNAGHRIPVEDLMMLSDESFSTMYDNTIWGHLHLEAMDLDAFKAFYVDQLGFKLMIEDAHALFTAKDGYHHHIAMNNWLKRKENLPAHKTGLIGFSLNMPELESQNLTDPSGIIVKINENA